MTMGAGAIDTGVKYFCDRMRHLVCVPYAVDNLHAMARDLGIGRHWFHGDHYDIPKRRFSDVSSRCTVISPKHVVGIISGVVTDPPSIRDLPESEVTIRLWECPDCSKPLTAAVVHTLSPEQGAALGREAAELGLTSRDVPLAEYRRMEGIMCECERPT